MRNFRKIISNALPFVLMFFIIEAGLSFVLVPADSYTRVAIHEMHTSKDNYDMVFLGASHTYRSFDTRIIDEMLGVNSFNAGSSSQSMKGGYFYLKEILRKHHPTKVVMELTYPNFNQYEWSENVLNEIILFEYFSPSLNKIEYFNAAFSPKDMGNVLLKSHRYRANIFSSLYLKNIRDKVTSSDYWQYKPIVTTNEYYVEKGFVYSNVIWNREKRPDLYYSWSSDKLLKEAFIYLDKVIRLCQAEGIEIQVVTAPMPVETLESLKNYDEIHAFFAEHLAKNYNLPYYDFNYVLPEAMDRSAPIFQDSNHMNGEGAARFSSLYATAVINNSYESLLGSSMTDIQ